MEPSLNPLRTPAGSFPFASMPASSQDGFTIVELVVTMVLVGILAVAVMPRFDALNGFDEVGYRDQVKATLEYARKAAVAQRRWMCVDMNGGGNGLVFTRDLAEPETRTVATVDCTGALVLPGSNANTIVAPAGVVFAAPAAKVMFDPLGRAWGPANDCTPTSTAQYCYSIQGTGSATAQIVTVERETGYVH